MSVNFHCLSSVEVLPSNLKQPDEVVPIKILMSYYFYCIIAYPLLLSYHSLPPPYCVSEGLKQVQYVGGEREREIYYITKTFCYFIIL